MELLKRKSCTEIECGRTWFRNCVRTQKIMLLSGRRLHVYKAHRNPTNKLYGIFYQDRLETSIPDSKQNETNISDIYIFLILMILDVQASFDAYPIIGSRQHPSHSNQVHEDQRCLDKALRKLLLQGVEIIVKLVMLPELPFGTDDLLNKQSVSGENLFDGG